MESGLIIYLMNLYIINNPLNSKLKYSKQKIVTFSSVFLITKSRKINRILFDQIAHSVIVELMGKNAPKGKNKALGLFMEILCQFSWTEEPVLSGISLIGSW